MKAIAFSRYGSPAVLRLEDAPMPVPRASDVLVKVHAASVNALDWRIMSANPFLVRLMFGLRRPRIGRLGADVAGRVEAVGPQVTRFRPGDEVFGDAFGAGLGAFAEYACVAEEQLAVKPANLSFEEAAAVPVAAVTALRGLRDVGRIQPGDKVLIHGAAGGVGTFSVQIARHFGAAVTALCSARNAEQARALGAQRVFDYAREDFLGDGVRYDLILGVNGYRSLLDFRRALAPGGRFVMAGGSPALFYQAMLLAPWLSMAGSRKLKVLSAKTTAEDLAFLAALLESGQIRPVIERRYPLADVPAAIGYVMEGHARGKIVITV